MGAPHEYCDPVILGLVYSWRVQKVEVPTLMKYGRHLAFWITTFLVLFAVIWLLRGILLPFVAGLALAYVQAPLADRLERLGMNRTLAALLIVAVVVLALLGIALLLFRCWAAGIGIAHQSARLRYPHPRADRGIRLPWLRSLIGGESEQDVDRAGRAARPVGSPLLPPRSGQAEKRWHRLLPS